MALGRALALDASPGAGESAALRKGLDTVYSIPHLIDQYALRLMFGRVNGQMENVENNSRYIKSAKILVHAVNAVTNYCF